jgi:hypothetical protein
MYCSQNSAQAHKSKDAHMQQEQNMPSLLPQQKVLPQRLRPDQVLLKILRCTAHSMANSPGGLRFVAGTRPWLEGLKGGIQRLPDGHQG